MINIEESIPAIKVLKVWYDKYGRERVTVEYKKVKVVEIE